MASYYLIARTFSGPIRRLFLAQGFVGTGTGIFAVLLNLYLRSMGYSEDSIGRFLAFQALCAAGMSIPMGWLADVKSRKITYIIGTLLLAAGNAAVIFSNGSFSTLVAFFVAGSGTGAMMVSVQPFLQENSRRRQRPYIFSFNYTISWIMSILSGFLAGWLPKLFIFLSIFACAGEAERLRYSLAVGILFMIVAVWPAMKLSGKVTSKINPANVDISIPESDSCDPKILIAKFAFCNMLIGLGAGMIVPYFNLYFKDWVGASIPQIGAIFALGQFGTAIGAVSSPWLAKKFGSVNGVVVSQLFSLPFMAIMAWRHEYWICALCFIFRSAFMNMSMPMRQETMMASLPDKYRARAAAADSMAWNLSWSASMFFSGGIIRNWGYDFSLLAAFICYLTSSIAYFRFFYSSGKAHKTVL